jgi:hypothetical protein
LESKTKDKINLKQELKQEGREDGGGKGHGDVVISELAWQEAF